MVSGVNYNYNLAEQYKSQQPVDKNGNPCRWLDTIYTEGSIIQPQLATQNQTQQAQDKKDTENKDDGKIGFWSATGHFLKGCGKLVTGMFTDEKGNFSWKQTLKTALIGAAIYLIPGAAPIALAVGGLMAAYGAIKAGVNIANAKTDAEDKAAWESMGSNVLALVGTAVGARAYAKGAAASNGVDASRYSSTFKGTARSIGRTFTDSGRNIGSGVSQGWKAAGTGARKMNTFRQMDKEQRLARLNEYKTEYRAKASEKFDNVKTNTSEYIGEKFDKFTDYVTKKDETAWSKGLKTKAGKAIKHPVKAGKYVAHKAADKYKKVENNPKSAGKIGTLTVASHNTIKPDDQEQKVYYAA